MTSEIGMLNLVLPVVSALMFITLTSLFPEPARRNFMAIVVAGAGAAYLSGGGMGPWEMVFNTLMTICAYFGLKSYRFIGIAWLLHTGWDVLHHLNGHPIIPFYAISSFGCAICDPVIALWCFVGAPSIIDLFRGRRLQPV